MKKPKSSKRESESSERWDRLSELPNSLILHILSLLPMRDVVRTTLLSKRWKDLWTTIPCLHFHEDKSLRFQKFVNGALILWRGSKILKFGVDFYYKQSAYNDLDLWLRVALENEVEELHVNLLSHWDVSDGFIDTEYWAPQRLYSCISITKLSLVGCQLKIHGKVQWDRIKSLTIEDVCLSENVMNQVLSGSPQLEILILRLLESIESLNIRSSSLKTLKIEKYSDEKEDLVLTIWAPNVETFKIRGVLYDKYVLMDISSLTNATVCSECGDDDYDTVGYSCYKVVEDILEQVYRTNCRVDKVTLSHCGIKVLGEMKKKDMVAPLSNAKFLKLYATKVDGIVRLLEIFPKLTKLVLEGRGPWITDYRDITKIRCDIREPFVTKFDTENSLESKTDFPESCLLHLTTVEIFWNVNECNGSMLPIIEFLLKYASKLEKLVLRVVGNSLLEPKFLLLTAEKLLRMPRASPTAEVILR